MKRRRFFRSLAVAPAVGGLLAQQSTVPNNTPSPASPSPPPPNAAVPPAPFNRTPEAAAESPKLATAIPDEAADMAPRFFQPEQFAALRKISELLMPSINGAPGALEASAPEFLDFLISESPSDRQKIYREGLDALNHEARSKFRKPFAELGTANASSLLAPLRQPWTYDGPSDPLGQFLWAAKQDVRAATMNSREYATSDRAGGGRRGGGGVGLYWYPVD